MAIQDLASKIQAFTMIPPDVHDDDPFTAGGNFAKFEYSESLAIVIRLGFYIDGAHAFSIKDGEFGGDDVDADDIWLAQNPKPGSFSISDSNPIFTFDSSNQANISSETIVIGYRGTGAQVGVEVSVSGATDGAAYCVMGILDDLRRRPSVDAPTGLD